MREVNVTLYTRGGCSLCEKAKATILASGYALCLTEVDIDGDPELVRRYNDDVPVVHIDGMEAFRHHVDPHGFAMVIARRSALVAAPAAPSSAPASLLAGEKCVPCRGGVPSLQGEELRVLMSELGGDWKVVDEHHLEKELTFPDFATALSFTNRVGAVAEEEGHHPDIHLAWGKVRLTIWTHKIDGLTRSDFVLAAKIDAIKR
jgi:4a-hydroxytetrahydrobiopterin dehydratase